MKTKLTAQNASLNDVLDFKLPVLVRQLQEELHLNKRDAECLFNDTKKFLFLCGLKRVLVPSKPIDECWHRFILHTESYFEFCRRFLGRYVHHRPVTKKSESAMLRKIFIKTRKFAQKIFGPNLSPNWKAQSDCSKCGDCTCRDRPDLLIAF